MDVVHADAGGEVLENEMVVERACGTPALEFQIGDEFRLVGCVPSM
jgi:hypothetical protein